MLACDHIYYDMNFDFLSACLCSEYNAAKSVIDKLKKEQEDLRNQRDVRTLCHRFIMYMTRTIPILNTCTRCLILRLVIEVWIIQSTGRLDSSRIESCISNYLFQLLMHGLGHVRGQIIFNYTGQGLC